MFSKKPRRIEAVNGKAIKIGDWLFLPCTHKGTFETLHYKVEKNESAFLGTPYEGSKGYATSIGGKMESGLKGYYLKEINPVYDEEGNRKISAFTVVLVR